MPGRKYKAKAEEAPTGDAVETSHKSGNFSCSDYTEKSEDSQEDGHEKRLENEQIRRGTGRTRVYAIVVYPDSAPSDWQERLTQEHVSAFISPLHDKDKNPDGTQKKPHWHVMLMYDGVKSQEQVDALWDRVLGPDRVKHYETVNSTRGYGRYLCHMDNPEKAQYDRADVVSLSGADYDEVISLPSDDWAVLDEIFAYLEETGERYYSRFMAYCRRERRDWWKLLIQRHSYVVVSWMKSEQARERDEMMRRDARHYGQQVDTATGEILED